MTETQLTRQITVFADASQRHRSIGYAVAIVSEYGDPKYESGSLPHIKTNTAGEIAALAIGVAKCPPCDRVVVFTDLADLPGIMGENRRVSYHDSIATEVEALRDACRNFKRVEFRIVDKANEIYRECDRLAYKSAGKCARKMGRLPIQTKK